MEIQDILNEAFKISNKQKFKVRFYYDDKLLEVKEMSYLELGIYLTSNTNDIKTVDIRR